MASELPSELLLKIFSSSFPSQALEGYANQEPGWLRVGKELSQYACVCRAWRMALVPPRREARARGRGSIDQHANEEEAFQSRLWKKVCLAQTRTAAWRISTSYLHKFDGIGDWYREFLTRARWYRRVHHCLKEEVVWPNLRNDTLEKLARDLHLSQSLLTEISNESCQVVGYAKVKMEEEGLRSIPVGNKYWSKDVLWKLKTVSAEHQMERACKPQDKDDMTDEEDEVLTEEEEWERLCRRPEEVHLEKGDSVCRKRDELSELEQVKVLNSLMFNGVRVIDSDVTTTPFLESFQAFRSEECAVKCVTAMHKFGWEEVLESWPGLGVRGNRTDYYNPKNSCVSDILGIFFVPQRFHEEYEQLMMSKRRNNNNCPNPNPLLFLEKDCAPQEAGIPISIAVVYAAVGRRAGVPVRMVSTPGHFLAGIGREVFVDVFAGIIKTREDIVSWMNQIYHISSFQQDEQKGVDGFLKCVSPKEINIRLCMNLIHIFEDVMDYKKLLSIVRLAMVLLPNSPDLLMKHAKVQAMLDEYDLAIESLDQVRTGVTGRGSSQRNSSKESHVVDHCKKFINHFKMAKMLYLKDSSLKRFRPKGGQVLFRVGQVINHHRYAYRGVIYGWDLKCEAGERWIEQMRVDELPLGRDQPFYRVLVDCRDRNSQSTYVAQENIRVEKEPSSSSSSAGDSRLDNRQIDHPQVGHYFESYLLSHWHVKGQHYLPNALVRSQYPED
jgi:F-box protein 21